MPAESKTAELILRLRNEISTNAEKAERSLSKLEKRTLRVDETMSKATMAVKRFIGPLALIGLTKAVIDAGRVTEDATARLRAMTGSLEGANRELAIFQRIAATVPFSLKDVIEAGITLRSFGGDNEKALKAVADLAAFMGVNIPDAARAYGRAFAAGAGAADMLRDRGVLALMQTKAKIEDLSKLSLPEFRRVLLETMEDTTAGIAGSTELLSKTFTGQVSMMEDAWFKFLDALAKGGALSVATKTIRLMEMALIGLRRELERFGILPPSDFMKNVTDASEAVEEWEATVSRLTGIPVERIKQSGIGQLEEIASSQEVAVRMAIFRLIRAKKELDQEFSNVAKAPPVTPPPGGDGGDTRPTAKDIKEADARTRKIVAIWDRITRGRIRTQEEERRREGEAFDAQQDRARRHAALLMQIDAERKRSLEETIEKMKKLEEKANERLRKIEASIGGVFDSMKSGMRETIRGILLGTQSIEDGFRNMFRNIALAAAEALVQQAVVNPLIQLLSGGIASIFTGAGFASFFGGFSGMNAAGSFGGAATAGVAAPLGDIGVTSLQHGGLVKKGQRGLAYFEGLKDEAVIPLDSNRANIGSNTTVVIQNFTGEKVEQSQRDNVGRREILVTIGKEMGKNIREGGDLARAMEQTYGVSRQGARR